MSKTLVVEIYFELVGCAVEKGTAAVLVTNAIPLIRFTDLKSPAFCSFIRKVLISPTFRDMIMQLYSGKSKLIIIEIQIYGRGM